MTPTKRDSTSEQRQFDVCDHCKERGELGHEMRAHVVTVPGKNYRVVRVLHVERCTAAWFAKYNAWLSERSQGQSITSTTDGGTDASK